MPRRKLIRSAFLPYHVTARTNRRETFQTFPHQTWEILGDEGLFLSMIHGVEIHALVMMPNHFHMILTCPEIDLGTVMNEFLKSVSRRINRLSDKTGHVFGGPYYWTLVNNSRYFRHVLKYVYRNPAKAKLCASVEDYPYSTLHGLLGKSHLPFPIHQTRAALELGLKSADPSEQLTWLNQPFPNEIDSIIQKRLRRTLFEAGKDGRTRRFFELLQGAD